MNSRGAKPPLDPQSRGDHPLGDLLFDPLEKAKGESCDLINGKLLPLLGMSLSSSSQYDATQWKVKRFVTVNHTEAVSLMRGLFAGIAGIFGGPVDSMNKKMDDVTNALTQKLLQQMGSDEIMVGVHIQFAEFGRSESNTFLSGSAVGTLLTPIDTSPLAMKQGGKQSRRSRRTR